MTTTDVSVFLMATGLPGTDGRSVEKIRETEGDEERWNQTVAVILCLPCVKQ